MQPRHNVLFYVKSDSITPLAKTTRLNASAIGVQLIEAGATVLVAYLDAREM